jgi:hypothetical protein
MRLVQWWLTSEGKAQRVRTYGAKYLDRVGQHLTLFAHNWQVFGFNLNPFDPSFEDFSFPRDPLTPASAACWDRNSSRAHSRSGRIQSQTSIEASTAAG